MQTRAEDRLPVLQGHPPAPGPPWPVSLLPDGGQQVCAAHLLRAAVFPEPGRAAPDAGGPVALLPGGRRRRAMAGGQQALAQAAGAGSVGDGRHGELLLAEAAGAKEAQDGRLCFAVRSWAGAFKIF